MNGLYQDILILLLIGGCGVWIIHKYYDLLERLENKDKEIRVIQEKLIELMQNDINIDGKYKIKHKWTVEKIEDLVTKLEKVIESSDVNNQCLNTLLNTLSLKDWLNHSDNEDYIDFKAANEIRQDVDDV